MKSSLACHFLIKKTAQEFAGAFYEGAAHDNEFYKWYPSERFFVDYEWGRFIPHARQVLATMLARNDVAESMKEEIMEAIILDRSMPGSWQHGTEDPMLKLQ